MMLEMAMKKLNRFGWDGMDVTSKDELSFSWLEHLKGNTLKEIKDGIHSFLTKTKGSQRSINEYQVKHEIDQAHKRLVKLLPEKRQLENARDFSPEAIARRRALSAKLFGKSTHRMKV
jgi:hypothetical protein